MQRPHTCPALTPQFHWNLNAHAVETLSETDLAQAYQLFRFYDSSCVGDTLPSINCRRLLQLLQDGGLVLDGAAPDDVQDGVETARIDALAVEKLFAEAVLGKLRTYLDSDGQPALTFPLFCGVLLHCATMVFPVLRAEPEAALTTLLNRLLHFPDDGRIALWRPGGAYGTLAPMPSSDCSRAADLHEDFRRLEPFQQVLSTFSLDVARDAKARERSQRQYTIPLELAAHFSAEHLDVVVERFRLFDVFDRGSLPRQEVLPLLAGLVKKLEIPDMYAVLALLMTGDPASKAEGGKGAAASGDVSHRRQSTLLLKDDALAVRAAASAMRRKASRRASRTSDAALVSIEDDVSEPEGISAAGDAQRNSSRPNAPEAATGTRLDSGSASDDDDDDDGNGNDNDATGHRLSRLETARETPPPAAAATRFRVFMLLGGEHDGAVCYSIELTLPQRRLEEASGVFYLHAPPETLARTPVLPVQPDAESALRLLRKRVRQRQREGFALHPRALLERVDAALARVRSRNPHYARALRQPVTPTTPSIHATRDREGPAPGVRGSLDRGATRVRQRSASDLRATLSDPHLNRELRDRRRAATRSASADEHEQSPATPDADRSSGVAWIRALNDAVHQRAQLQPIQEPTRAQR
ncbi:hypothetical protein PybrP1_008843 [[Pythium] brassicae (nom. inval.)]|nr:hypothetical protein PybrP1_008843 [[Pythium] brassicae (nom. inval.)]